MLPIVNVFGVTMQTSILTAFVCFVAIVSLLKGHRYRSGHLSWFEVFYFAGTSFVLAWFGAKLGFVLFERHLVSFLGVFDELMRPGGRVLYGALLVSGLGVYALTASHREREELRWTGVQAGGLGILILRLQCFFDGCCWGTATDAPWSVVYTHDASVMPYLGVPVHPTQLYEAVLGFFLLVSVPVLKRHIRTPWIGFFGPYAIGRFVIEFFRGDASRGENILWIFSTSQLISIVIMTVILCVSLSSFRTSSANVPT